MKINKSDLANKLSKIKSIASSKNNGAFSGILLKNNFLIANNGEIVVKAKLNIDTDETFIIPNNAVSMIESLPAGEIVLSVVDNTLHIKAGNIKNKYITKSTDTFPALAEIDKTTSEAKLESSELIKALSSIQYAISNNDTKPTFAGAYLEAKDGLLNIVSLDGFRSAWYKLKYDGEFSVIIPRNTIKKLLDLGISGDVSFAWNFNEIIFKSEEYELHSKIISGEYFNYRQIYNNRETKVIFDKKVLAECLHRAMLCAAGIETEVKPIIFAFSSDNLTISTKQALSEYEETIKVKTPVIQSDTELVIAFNGKYIIEAIKSFDNDELNVYFGENLNPAVIESEKLSAVILPVRIKE